MFLSSRTLCYPKQLQPSSIVAIFHYKPPQAICGRYHEIQICEMLEKAASERWYMSSSNNEVNILIKADEEYCYQN